MSMWGPQSFDTSHAPDVCGQQTLGGRGAAASGGWAEPLSAGRSARRRRSAWASDTPWAGQVHALGRLRDSDTVAGTADWGSPGWGTLGERAGQTVVRWGAVCGDLLSQVLSGTVGCDMGACLRPWNSSAAEQSGSRMVLGPLRGQ